MTTVKEIQRYILSCYDHLEISGRACLVSPVNTSVRGLFFDRSIDKNIFILKYFIMPLYVPSFHLNFNMGGRIKSIYTNSDRWDISSVNLKDVENSIRESYFYMLEVNDYNDVVRVCEQTLTSGENLNVCEALIYSQIRSNQSADHISVIKRFCKSVDITIPWQSDVLQRMILVRNALLEDNDNLLNELFRSWETITIENLKLEKLVK